MTTTTTTTYQHPKMIKNYFEKPNEPTPLPTIATTSSPSSPPPPTSPSPPSPTNSTNSTTVGNVRKSNCIVPKNLKRKIRDILEDENKRSTDGCLNNENMTTNVKTGASETKNVVTLKSSNVQSNTTASTSPVGSSQVKKPKITRAACDTVKVVTRINLPMANRAAVLRNNANTNKSTSELMNTTSGKIMSLSRILQVGKLAAAVVNGQPVSQCQRVFLDVKRLELLSNVAHSHLHNRIYRLEQEQK